MRPRTFATPRLPPGKMVLSCGISIALALRQASRLESTRVLRRSTTATIATNGRDAQQIAHRAADGICEASAATADGARWRSRPERVRRGRRRHAAR